MEVDADKQMGAVAAELHLFHQKTSAGQRIAAACGVPLIGVFAGFPAPRMFERWRPVGPNCQVIRVDQPDPAETIERVREALRLQKDRPPGLSPGTSSLFAPMAAALTQLGEQERTKRERALANTVANLRIENLRLDEESNGIFQRHVDGEIGFQEFRAAIDELNERRFGPVSGSRNGRS